jgi:hypothetical protein
VTTERLKRVWRLERLSSRASVSFSFIMFTFAIIGPPVGWWVFLLYFAARSVVADLPTPVDATAHAWPSAGVFAFMFLFGSIASYVWGIVPALVAGAVVCLVRTAGLRISWMAMIAAAVAGEAASMQLSLTLSHSGLLLVFVACLAPTSVCSWIVDRVLIPSDQAERNGRREILP